MQLHDSCLCIRHNSTRHAFAWENTLSQCGLSPQDPTETQLWKLWLALRSSWSKNGMLYGHALRRGLRHLHSKELSPQAQEVGPWKESSCTKHRHPCLASPRTQHWQTLINVGNVWMAGTTPRGLPDRVELLMVLAGVVTSGSSWAHSAGGRAGFSGSSWRSPEQGAASPCSTSVEIASLGSRPELSLCLLLSVSEELDVDNCCLN